MINYPEAYAWLIAQPAGKARDGLLKHIAARVKVRAPKPAIRFPRGAKPASIPKLKKELDRVFSIFTRTKDADENGMVSCVTCGRRAYWKEMDAGHYVPRQDLAVRWDPRNVWPQCRPDNVFRGGEPEKMAIYINQTCGAGVAESLRALARQGLKLQRSWLEIKIKEYKAKIGEAAGG